MIPAKFDRILRQAFILPICVLLLAAAALFWGISQTTNTVHLIQREDECIASATQTEKLIVDEESGLRGYQVTGDPQFLEPYTRAQPELQANLDRLRTLLASDAGDLDALERAHELWQVGFARPLVGILQGGGEASDISLNLIGKNRMDVVRAAIDRIIRDAESRRFDSIKRWSRQVQVTLTSLLALATLAGVLIGLFTRNRLKSVSAAYGEAQEVLRAQAAEVFASEQNLRTTLASIGDGVITCDREGHILMMNDIAQDLTGWRQEEAEGQPIASVLRLIDERSRQSIENPVKFVNRLNREADSPADVVLLRRDGSERIIDNNGAPIRDQGDQIVGSVTVFRDVTIERKTRDALLANEKLAVAGRLAATIAHEIYNPLDAVANLLFLMKSSTNPNETAHFLGLAQKELMRVTRVSRAMLGLYRESRAPVPVDLREMVASLLLLMDGRFQTLGVRVTEDVPSQLQVEGFPAELRQVFTNLITNAAEAAANQPGGAVRISAARAAGTAGESAAIVTVSDNGAGIAPEFREQLFRPFFTTKGEQGTGLGLWVSQGIIHKHGGRIEVESSTDADAHGTIISIFFAAKPALQVSGD